MRKIHVFRADPTRSDKPVEPVTIVIAEAPPPSDFWTADGQRDEFNRDAEALANALFGSLPGATFDALLVRMLERKASSLRVPLPDSEPR